METCSRESHTRLYVILQERSDTSGTAVKTACEKSLCHLQDCSSLVHCSGKLAGKVPTASRGYVDDV